jgi:hypothetical protein
MELLERGRKLRQSGDIPAALAAFEAAADSEPLNVTAKIGDSVPILFQLLA